MLHSHSSREWTTTDFDGSPQRTATTDDCTNSTLAAREREGKESLLRLLPYDLTRDGVVGRQERRERAKKCLELQLRPS